MDSHSHATQQIKTGLRLMAQEALQLTLGGSKVEVLPLATPDDFLYGELMGYVLMHSAPIKINFKVHYSQSLARAMTSSYLDLPPAAIPPSLCLDFMREYCNLVAGFSVDWLTAQGHTLTMSIPFITDGFDEVWFSDTLHPDEGRDYWQLLCPQGSLVCSSTLRVSPAANLQGLSLPTAQPTPPAAPIGRRIKTL